MLDTWNAERLEHVLEKGRTRPMVVRCTKVPSATADDPEAPFDDTPERKSFVVKALGHPEVTEKNLFSEIFGNLLARELEVSTPAPALITLGSEFVRAAGPSLKRDHGINLREGLGVGCEYFRHGFTSIVPGIPLDEEETLQARNIFGFDLLAQNPDRNRRKVNCALLSGNLIAYDFELAFSFLYPIIGQKEPWEVSQHGLCKEHVFQPMLRKKRVDFKPFVELVGELSEVRLQTLLGAVPDAWQEWGETVCCHFGKVVANVSKLEVELRRSLL